MPTGKPWLDPQWWRARISRGRQRDIHIEHGIKACFQGRHRRFWQAAILSLRALKSPPLLAGMQALALQGISEEIQLDIHLQQCISARTGVRQPQGAGGAPRLANFLKS